MREGDYTLDGYSTDPPKTLISHTTMFTGLGADNNWKSDNLRQPGEPTIECKTIFTSPKQNVYQTCFDYSKRKLGYRVNEALDVYRWSREDAVTVGRGDGISLGNNAPGDAKNCCG
jgi:hypothetical protein